MLLARSFHRILAAVLIAVSLCAALPALAQSVSGSYRAEGRNPDGSAYRGAVTVSETGGKVAINWTVGPQAYAGTGSRNGDVIWVDWGEAHPVVYVRMPSGELHGTWANGTALERLIPQ